TISMNPLVAVDDTISSCSSSTVRIDGLANDYDVEAGNPLSIVAVDGAQYGSVQINPDNTLTYTRSSNVGSDPNSFIDSFIYTITDGLGHYATATVHLTIDFVTANDDNAQVFEGQPVTIPVLDNDSSLIGGTLAITSVTQGSQGTVTISADHTTVTYNSGPSTLTILSPPS